MTIEDLIAAANPAPVATIGAGDYARARRTLAQILASPERASLGMAPHRGRRSRRLMLPVALAGVAATAAAAVVVTLLPAAPGRPGPVGPSGHPTAGSLAALAVAAAAQPMQPPLRHGQFEYTQSTSLNWVDTYNATPGTSYNVSYIERLQIWISPTGAGRMVESYRDPRFGSPADRAHWIAAGRPDLRIRPSDTIYKAGKDGLSVGPKGLLKLPTNPARLAPIVLGGKIDGGPHTAAEAFVRIGDLLRQTDAPPALRAAIFKVAGMIPGAKVLGAVTDPGGQSGVAIAHWQHFAAQGSVLAQVDESVLIFSPKTSRLLAEETYVTYAKTGKTVLTSWTDYLKSGVVDSLTSTTPNPAGSGPAGSGPA
jgi:hypothetical protein